MIPAIVSASMTNCKYVHNGALSFEPSCPCLPQAPAAPLRLEDTGLSREDEGRILGSQANLWTEYISDEGTAEYMLLPRLCAMAEALWCAEG